MSQDQRRKLSGNDYQLIKFYYTSQSSTIRELAGEFGVSTKYVKRILQNSFIPTANPVQVTMMLDINACSGCGRTFSSSGLQDHWNIWTGSGTQSLSCLTVMPGITR